MAGRRRLFDINAVAVGIGHEQALAVGEEGDDVRFRVSSEDRRSEGRDGGK